MRAQSRAVVFTHIDCIMFSNKFQLASPYQLTALSHVVGWYLEHTSSVACIYIGLPLSKIGKNVSLNFGNILSRPTDCVLFFTNELKLIAWGHNFSCIVFKMNFDVLSSLYIDKRKLSVTENQILHVYLTSEIVKEFSFHFLLNKWRYNPFIELRNVLRAEYWGTVSQNTRMWLILWIPTYVYKKDTVHHLHLGFRKMSKLFEWCH